MLADNARATCANDRPPKRHGDCEAERRGRQGKLQSERMGRARNDSGIKAEEEAT